MDPAETSARLHALGLEPARLAIEPLASHHNRAAFSCGEPALDKYLQTKVGQDLRRRLAHCSVLAPEAGATTIVGYYTLSAHTIDLTELDEASRRKLRAYAVLPAILLGRLAVDRRYQGARLGWLLMMHALQACLEISFQAGSMSVVVEALHEQAAGFYADLGFAPIGHDPLRLHLPFGTVAALSPRQATALRAKWGRPGNPFAVVDAEREP